MLNPELIKVIVPYLQSKQSSVIDFVILNFLTVKYDASS